jgi:hypothetical protein
MKSIGPEIARKIEDFALESSVLPGYAIEKDFFVFDAIKLLSTLPANTWLW